MEPIQPSDLQPIFEKFELGGDILAIHPVSAGHINDTFASRVRTSDGRTLLCAPAHQPSRLSPSRTGDGKYHRASPQHASRQIVLEGGDPTAPDPAPGAGARWRPVLPHPGGDTWRTYFGIEGARTYEVPENPEQVYHAARAFGRFQKLLSTLPGERLHETIPDFHHTPKRLAALLAVVQADPCGRAAQARAEIDLYPGAPGRCFPGG